MRLTSTWTWITTITAVGVMAVAMLGVTTAVQRNDPLRVATCLKVFGAMDDRPQQYFAGQWLAT